MEENSKNAVTLVDLVKLFQKKFKALIVVALLAAILGGVLGGFFTVRATTYCADMEISVSPTDDGDALLYMLRSGRFAEQLLVEKNGLPPKDQCNAEDYDAALKALEELEAIRALRMEKYEEFSRHYVTDVEHVYKALTEEYDGVLTVLKMYKEAQADALVNETHEARIAEYEAKLAEVSQKRKEYYDNHYAPPMEKKFMLETELARLTDQFVDKKKDADAAVEKVMSAWRYSDNASDRISVLTNFVTYEYHILEEETAKDAAQKAAQYGYIQIKIAVPADAIPASYASGEDYVRSLVDCFETRLADRLSALLQEDLNVYETECVMINPLVQVRRVPGDVRSAAILYGVIGAVVGVVLAYVVFVLQLAMKLQEENTAKAVQTEAVASDPKAEKK